MLGSVACSLQIYAVGLGWIFSPRTNDDDPRGPLVDTWTFCSPMGIMRRIAFIFSSRLVGCAVLLPRICWIEDQTTKRCVHWQWTHKKGATWTASSKKGLEIHTGFLWLSEFISWNVTCWAWTWATIAVWIGVFLLQRFCTHELGCSKTFRTKNNVWWCFSCFIGWAEKRDQSRTGHNYPNLFGNIFGGHFVSREMFGFNMFWMHSRSWTVWRIVLVHQFHCSTRRNAVVRMNMQKFLENNIGSEIGFGSPNY